LTDGLRANWRGGAHATEAENADLSDCQAPYDLIHPNPRQAVSSREGL